MFNRALFDNSRPGGLAVLEVARKDEGKGEPRLFVPLQRTELHGSVVGPLASLRLTQTYGYTRQQCATVLEALYRFPLPGDAAVLGVAARFGDVEIKAELRERAQAEQEYESAKQQGRQALLATRESPDAFTLKLAGIRPDEAVIIETAYVQLARAEGSGWSLRVPLTTAPRYARSDEAGSHHADGQPLLLVRDPGHRFALDIVVEGATDVTSPTHGLATTAAGPAWRVSLADGEVVPDRDCLLHWRAPGAEARPTLQAWQHDDPATARTYFLALVAPPALKVRDRGPQREVIVLVDHSGSMSGAKWEASDWAVKRFLSGLSPQDAFALGLFHNDTRWLARAPEVATPQALERATAFLEEHRDTGGTELGVALEQALSVPRVSGRSSRHILIITDAQVTDAGRILQLADQETGRSDSRRISMLCIDAAPNSFLAYDLVRRGGGTARFLTSAPDADDITTALDEVLEDWSEPVLGQLSLETDRPGLQIADRRMPPGGAADLGDMPAGRSLWTAGWVPGGAGVPLALRLLSGRQELATWQGSAAPTCPAIQALCGAQRVRELEYLIAGSLQPAELRSQLLRLGYDPDVVLGGAPGQPARLYAENVRADTGAALHSLLVHESLAAGIACSETAFVATRQEAGQLVATTVLVANALPAGWSDQFLSPPAPMMAAAFRRSDQQPARAIVHPAPTTSAFVARSELLAGLGQQLSKRKAPRGRAAQPGASPASGPSAEPTPQSGAALVLFSGPPQFDQGKFVLFDASRPPDTARLPAFAVFQRLEVDWPGGAPPFATMDAGLTLLLFVGDIAAPRARVRLVDMLRQGGSRPLNLSWTAGEVLRLVMDAGASAWPYGALVIRLIMQ